MIAHLIHCTVAAALLGTFAVLLPRRSARLRFALLLIAVLRFAVPTAWLIEAGASLAERLPSATASARALPAWNANWDVPLKRAAALAFLPLPQPKPATTNLLRIAWLAPALLIFAAWLRRARRPVPRLRPANEREHLALTRAAALFPEVADPELRITDPQHTPGALGIWRHQIVLPEGFAAPFAEGELEAIFAHELAHFHRRDNLTALAVRAVVSTFWFHPLLWWMERRMLADRELACDELVLARGAAAAHYAAALAKVSHMAVAGAPVYANIATSHLQHRLELIMSFKNTTHRASWRALPATLALLALAVPASVAFLNAQPAPAPDPRASALYLEANAAYADKDYAKTRRLFEQMRTEFPADNRGLFGVAEMSMIEKQPAEALALLNAALEQSPGDRDILLAKANVLVRSFDYAGAIAVLEPLTAQSDTPAPIRAELEMRLGEANLRADILSQARIHFERARELAPTNIVPLLKLGIIAERTGDHAAVRSWYEAALRIDPNNMIAQNNLAYELAESGNDLDRALALVYALRAKLGHPDNADVADTLGWVYLKLNRPTDAAAEFIRAVLLLPDTDRPEWRSHLVAALDAGATISADPVEFRRLLTLPSTEEVRAQLVGLVRGK